MKILKQNQKQNKKVIPIKSYQSFRESKHNLNPSVELRHIYKYIYNLYKYIYKLISIFAYNLLGKQRKQNLYLYIKS